MSNESKVNISGPERVGSVITGAGLVVKGLKHKGLVGLLLGIAGGMLVARGFAGQCEAYRILGINTACKSCADVPATVDS